MINGSNKTQTKDRSEQGEDLQLGDLEVLEELPWQSGERILWQVSAEERKTKRVKLIYFIWIISCFLIDFLSVLNHFLTYFLVLMSFEFRNPISKSFCGSFGLFLSGFWSEINFLVSVGFLVLIPHHYVLKSTALGGVCICNWVNAGVFKLYLIPFKNFFKDAFHTF